MDFKCIYFYHNDRCAPDPAGVPAIVSGGLGDPGRWVRAVPRLPDGRQPDPGRDGSAAVGRRGPSAFGEQGRAWAASRSSTVRRDRSRRDDLETKGPAMIAPVSLLMAMPHRRTSHPAGCSMRPRACLLPPIVRPGIVLREISLSGGEYQGTIAQSPKKKAYQANLRHISSNTRGFGICVCMRGKGFEPLNSFKKRS